MEGQDMDDADQTPRARGWGGRGHPTIASPRTSLPARTESQSGRSDLSSRSSPSKQMSAMELSSGGFESRVISLTDPKLPPVLLSLLEELEECNIGLGVVSRNLQAEIDELGRQDRSFHLFKDHVFASPSDRDQLGPTPSLDEVASLLEEAKACRLMFQSEPSWNTMVHYPLLKLAVYGPRRRDQLVGMVPCTNAKVIREYLPACSQFKKIDLCIYVVPEADGVADNAIKTTRGHLPCRTINHTDYYPLRNWPIAVSIETKNQAGEKLAAAELQLGTWHTAQWNLLEDLVAQSGGSFDGLPFLPAVVVKGDEWSFVATTRDGSKTLLWFNTVFGSTKTPLGVYSAVWGLQRLTKWAADTYWPWFRKNALGISER